MTRFSVRRSMAAAAIAATALIGTSATAQATPANSGYEPVTGIQNCWVGGHTWFGVQGGEVEVAACYDIQKDDQGYKVASVIRIRREEGTPAPVNLTTLVTGGEDQNATSATVDVSKDSVWHEVRSPWNRASGVYNAYGSYFAPGMKDANGWPVTTPRELDFMHNGDVWLP